MNTNNNTVILLTQQQSNGAYCHALCLHSDYEQLSEERPVPDNVEIMDEFLVRTLYPGAYRELIMQDPAHCISVWMEEFYSGKKNFTLEGKSIFTDSYIVNVLDDDTVKIIFFIGMCAIESAKFVLMLKEHLGDTLEIDICNTFKLTNFVQN